MNDRIPDDIVDLIDNIERQINNIPAIFDSTDLMSAINSINNIIQIWKEDHKYHI